MGKEVDIAIFNNYSVSPSIDFVADIRSGFNQIVTNFTPFYSAGDYYQNTYNADLVWEDTYGD